jgi:hypothetical protein
MAVDKERVKARFKEKFKTVALSNQRLDAIADKLAPKIVDDAEDGVIDAELDFLNDLHPDGAFLVMQKADDKSVNDKKKQTSNNQSNNSEQNNQQQNQQNQEQNDLSKLIAAAVSQAVAPLSEKLNALESEKQQATIQQLVEKHEKLKDVPKSYWGIAALPDKAEDIDAFVEKISTNYTAYKQEAANSSANGGKPPVGSGGANLKEASKEQVKSIVKNIMPSN